METKGDKVNTVTLSGSRRHSVHQQIFYYLCLLLAFCIPIHPRIIPPVIALIALNWLIDGYYVRTIPGLFKDSSRLIVLVPVILYLAYLAGMIYTTNLDYGWFDLQVKLSLLILPLIFSTSDRTKFDEKGRKHVLDAFISGCFAGSLILLAHSIVLRFQLGTTEVMYYRGLSWYFHPTYLALYFVFCIAIMGYRMISKKQEFSLRGIVLPVAMIIYFFMILFLLSSKAGILSLILATFLGFVYLVSIRKIYLKSVLLVIVVAAGCFLGFRFSPVLNQRFQRMDSTLASDLDSLKSASESNAERLVVWRAAAWVILQHPIIGTGTGDVKDALMAEYQHENSMVAYRQKLNAHNQYLQTAATLGFAGLAILLVILLIPAFIALRNTDFIFLTLILLFSFNILFESMLEVQAGTVFFAFFLTLFLWLSPGSKE